MLLTTLLISLCFVVPYCSASLKRKAVRDDLPPLKRQATEEERARFNRPITHDVMSTTVEVPFPVSFVQSEEPETVPALQPDQLFEEFVSYETLASAEGDATTVRIETLVRESVASSAELNDILSIVLAMLPNPQSPLMESSEEAAKPITTDELSNLMGDLQIGNVSAEEAAPEWNPNDMIVIDQEQETHNSSALVTMQQVISTIKESLKEEFNEVTSNIYFRDYLRVMQEAIEDRDKFKK